MKLNDHRLQLCQIISEIINHFNYFFKLCFPDIWPFFLSDTVNCNYWTDTNPKNYHEVHTRHLKKLNVWTRISSDRIIGPLLLQGNLNEDIY